MIRDIARYLPFIILIFFVSCKKDPGSTNESKPNEMKNSNENILEIAFHHVNGSSTSTNNTNSFSALIQLAEKQGAKEGINFDFVLQYEGEKVTAIHNPLFYFQYTVQSGDLHLKTEWKAPIPLINSKSKVTPDDFNFHILKIRSGDKELLIDREINKTTIEVEASETIIYSLRNGGFMKDGNVQSFKPGTYQLSFQFSIILADQESKPLQAVTLKTNSVMIHLE